MTPVIHLAGWTLVHFLWQGTLIGLATLLLLRLLRTSLPQVRYAVSCVALGAMLLAPPLTAWTLAAAAPAVEGRPPLRITKFLRVAPEGLTAHDTYFFIRARRHPGGPTAAPAATTPVAPGVWMPALVAAWLFGVCVLLIRLAGGWWRVRRLHADARALAPSTWQSLCDRMAVRVGVRRAVHVVDATFVDGPMVIGWLRPVVLLPVAAMAGLTPEQIEAILAHELAHVRRHDAFVNLCQSVAETLLFYHPAVWWTSARIRIEREHCCDDIALGVTGDAYGYAAALAQLEGWRVQPSSLSLAATGGSLLARVSRLLGAPERPARGGAVMTLTLGIALVLLAGTWGLVSARQPVAEAASGATRGAAPAWQMVFAHANGQMTLRGFTARELVRYAYQLPVSRVIGGPAWLDEDSFELTTSVDHVPTADETPGLVRRLLEDRFGLVAHEATTAVPVLALEVARPDGTLGPNLKPATAACFDQLAWIAAGAPPRSGRVDTATSCGTWEAGLASQRGLSITMGAFASTMRDRFDGAVPVDVVDRTGLQGVYDISLDYFRPAVAAMASRPSLRQTLGLVGFRLRRTLALAGVQPFEEVLESQLGLRLVPATSEAGAIVIDVIRRPLEGLTPP